MKRYDLRHLKDDFYGPNGRVTLRIDLRSWEKVGNFFYLEGLGGTFFHHFSKGIGRIYLKRSWGPLKAFYLEPSFTLLTGGVWNLGTLIWCG